MAAREIRRGLIGVFAVRGHVRPLLFVVMAGPVPAIRVFVLQKSKTWMPGTRPGMTK
jgi:hypothetical protein